MNGTLTARTDVHRPGLMNPADYLVLAYPCVFTEQSLDSGQDETVYVLESCADEWETMGSPAEATWAGHRRGVCDHCGSRVKYTAVVLHRASGDLITVGRDCVKRFFNVNWSNVERLAEARIRRERNLTNFRTAHPNAAAALEWAINPDNHPNAFARDLTARIIKGAQLTERQIAGLLSVHQTAVAPVAYTGGVQAIAGTIVKCTMKRDDFKSTRYRTAYKVSITVETKTGLKLWGTLPGQFADVMIPGDEQQYIGRPVTFRATVVPKDAGFATYSRPTSFVMGDAPKVEASPEPVADESSSDEDAALPVQVEAEPARAINGVPYPSDDAPAEEWETYLRTNRQRAGDPYRDEFSRARRHWYDLEDARAQAEEATPPAPAVRTDFILWHGQVVRPDCYGRTQREGVGNCIYGQCHIYRNHCLNCGKPRPTATKEEIAAVLAAHGDAGVLFYKTLEGKNNV